MLNKLNPLKEVSQLIGQNIDLVQGAGGNTSLKDGNVLWIKASGCWLSDATYKEIFIPVDRNNVLDSINNDNIKDILPTNNSSLRPSIETALHALMRQKYVVHVHAVNTLSIAVLSNGKKHTKKLLKGLNWAWVPYMMPGIELAQAVEQELANNDKINIIILANHGLVVGGDSIDQVLDLLQIIEEKMHRVLRQYSVNSTRHDRLSTIVNNSQYRLVKYAVAHLIACDNLALKIINKRALYPDHVVFLGAGPMKTISIDALEDTIKILKGNVIVVRDFGVIVRKDISENAESMLYCLANVLLRLQPDDELEYLSPNDEMKLMGWDAEKYRQSIQR
jgi:rhamnose utilization protein RhaD (predicted bifunctional aldolase and dehydrogenase)